MCYIFFMENKSSRNKTIDFSEEEGTLYLNDCIFEKDLPSKSIRLEDSIICGDTFSLLGRFEKEQFHCRPAIQYFQAV